MSNNSSKSRKDQKDATRQGIIEAATLVFAQGGILSSTTAEVARAAGISHGSVFAHFGTQEGLVSAVIEAFGESFARRLHELAGAGAGTREVLAACLRAIAEGEGFYARLVAEASLLPRAARDSLVAIQASICFHLSPAIEADEEAGMIKAMPLHLLFNTWIGLVHHYLANRDYFAPGASVVERRGEELLDHFMSLVSRGGYE